MKWRLGLVAILFFADRLIKHYLWLKILPGEGAGIIKPLLNLHGAFSLNIPTPFDQWLIPAMALITLLLAAKVFFAMRSGDPMVLWWGLLLAGAVSNLLDRITLGGVLDYIDVGFWPVFNMSDVYISLGVFMIVLHELIVSRRAHGTAP